MPPTLSELARPPRRVPLSLRLHLLFGRGQISVYALLAILLLGYLAVFGGPLKGRLLNFGPRGTVEVRIDDVQQTHQRWSDTYTWYISYVRDGKAYQSSCKSSTPLYKIRSRTEAFYSKLLPGVVWLPGTSPGGVGFFDRFPIFRFLGLFLCGLIGYAIVQAHRDRWRLIGILSEGIPALAQREVEDDLPPQGVRYRYTPTSSEEPVTLPVPPFSGRTYQDEEPLLYPPGDPGAAVLLCQLPEGVAVNSEGGWRGVSPIRCWLGLAPEKG